MRDIFKFVGKIGVLSLAFVCFTASSFVANAQESSVTSGKIQIDNEKATKVTETNSKSTSIFNVTDAKPYRFGQGQRDPFVPFGGNVAPTPVEPSTSFDINLREEAKLEKGETSSKEEKDVVDEPIVLPVRATGVLLSNDHSFAILAPAGDGKPSDSFLVGVGEKIGEYTVKSISSDKVVLIWQGKPYNVPVQKYEPKSKGGKVVLGDAPDKPTLPVPEIKKKEEKKQDVSEKTSEPSKEEPSNSQQSESANKEQKNETNTK
jgi:hypothetical protein